MKTVLKKLKKIYKNTKMAKNNAFKVCVFKFYYGMRHLNIRKGNKNKKVKFIKKQSVNSKWANFENPLAQGI